MLLEQPNQTIWIVFRSERRLVGFQFTTQLCHALLARLGLTAHHVHRFSCHADVMLHHEIDGPLRRRASANGEQRNERNETQDGKTKASGCYSISCYPEVF